MAHTICAHGPCSAPLTGGRQVFHTTSCARSANIAYGVLQQTLAASVQRVTDLTAQNTALAAQQTANSAAITAEQTRQTSLNSQVSTAQANLNDAAVAGENV